MTRQQILDQVWGAEPDVYSNVVDLYVSYLRRKLGELDRADRLRTVRGVGYTLRADGLTPVPMSPTDRLLRRTRRRLFVVTLGLLTLLVVGVGAATALVGPRLARRRRGPGARGRRLSQVAALGGELPTAGDGGHEADEQIPTGASTFLLVIDGSGAVVQNRRTARSPACRRSGDLTRPARGPGPPVDPPWPRQRSPADRPARPARSPQGFVQGGFELTLHDKQSQSLVLAVLVTGAMGLVAAAVITLFVTGRALVPIREGFESQRRFVADASHELRTPAALIRANAEVLQREGLVSREGEPLVADVIAEADRLGGLVGDLLQLAAWDETRLTVVPAPLDASALAADTIRGARALAAERGVNLEVDSEGPVPALADRDRLVQLLLVLVDNAIDHSPSGETVTVRVRAIGGKAVIDVDDRGPGIPVAERERIFEPFTRLTGTTRHGTGGTGLGLAIARRIADAHRGTIRADSPAAGGARFTVTLPGAHEGSPTGATR